MTMVYEVWDTLTANRIGAFPTEDEARALLLDVLRVNGAGMTRDMAVLSSDSDAPEDEPRLVLEGAEFLAECQATA